MTRTKTPKLLLTPKQKKTPVVRIKKIKKGKLKKVAKTIVAAAKKVWHGIEKMD